MEASSNKVKLKTELISKLMNIEHSVFNHYSIDFIYLSGSWATETNDWWSDIDIFISKPDFIPLSSKQKLNFLIEITAKLTQLTEFKNYQVSIL